LTPNFEETGVADRVSPLLTLSGVQLTPPGGRFA